MLSNGFYQILHNLDSPELRQLADHNPWRNPTSVIRQNLGTSGPARKIAYDCNSDILFWMGGHYNFRAEIMTLFNKLFYK